ncbi:MAG: nuclear transport factor 2 family protein [Myxococcales bacterium]|nr:nuclear transport factor 2 family protein [Myxococcales bacterium]
MLWICIAMAHATPTDDIDAVLDGLHRAAADADASAYFGAFTDDAVFLGTDPGERWELEAFRTFAAPHFEQAPAWVYTPVERHVTLDAKGKVAWFDESLDHERYGRVRGSGVLVRQGKVWRVSQYVLSFTVLNEVSALVVAANQGQAWLPTPFTAAQIRQAMPVGLATRWRQIGEAGESQVTWKVVEADEEGMTQEHLTEGSDAAPRTSASWVQLRDHARFPAAHTEVVDEVVDTALGPLPCRRYTVTRDDEVTTFWFSPSHPGPPLRYTSTKGDTVTLVHELVSREEPR